MPADSPSQFAPLHNLIEQGEAMLTTKRMPPAKLHGDWQVMETTYSVVERETFSQWRHTVLSWLAATYGEQSEHYWTFFDECRVPFFLEAKQGVGLLRTLVNNAT